MISYAHHGYRTAKSVSAERVLANIEIRSLHVHFLRWTRVFRASREKTLIRGSWPRCLPSQPYDDIIEVVDIAMIKVAQTIPIYKHSY